MHTRVPVCVPAESAKIRMYNTIEYVCIAIFTAEYLGKCVSAPRVRAMLTPMNIIDLVAILPFYVELATLSSEEHRGDVQHDRPHRALVQLRGAVRRVPAGQVPPDDGLDGPRAEEGPAQLSG